MQTYPTGYAESHRIAEQIFREILPRHGMAVREEQIALCHEVLDTLYPCKVILPNGTELCRFSLRCARTEKPWRGRRI